MNLKIRKSLIFLFFTQDQLPLPANQDTCIRGSSSTKIRLYIFMAQTVPNSMEPTFLAPANPLALMKNGIIPPRFITLL